jgi:hypothetical protein
LKPKSRCCRRRARGADRGGTATGATPAPRISRSCRHCADRGRGSLLAGGRWQLRAACDVRSRRTALAGRSDRPRAERERRSLPGCGPGADWRGNDDSGHRMPYPLGGNPASWLASERPRPHRLSTRSAGDRCRGPVREFSNRPPCVSPWPPPGIPSDGIAMMVESSRPAYRPAREPARSHAERRCSRASRAPSVTRCPLAR